MKVKRGFDQAAAWAISVILSGVVFTAIYAGVAFVAGSKKSYSSSGYESTASTSHNDTTHSEEHGPKQAAASHKKVTEKHGDDHSQADQETQHAAIETGDHLDEEKNPEHGEQQEYAELTEHAEPTIALRAKSHVKEKHNVTERKDTEASPWTYKGPAGPEYWGDLSKSNVACSVGQSQSPVDIGQATKSLKLHPIKLQYKATTAEMINDGRILRLDVGHGSSATFPDDTYQLTEVFFHAPSEHKLEGIPFDMEIQMVHKNAKGATAVMSVLVEEANSDNKSIASLWKKLPESSIVPLEINAFNAEHLLPKERDYYRYAGSLTTPPCTEGVDWYVLATPIRVSSRQIDKFIHLMKYNSRPVQPLHARAVEKSR